ncbi:serine/threonine protein kinase, FIKK family, putative [Plasmodium reichenowi]|uniref:non-specific serine/threonine protein kinase n=2 Tax=Plasmodium reichenowi TaxID=5854 RepID=A0A2P9DCI7_PLARE|nr:serine/threonine protein kinase, FIKK family, putative [Plasmodium reichenowi]
MEYLYFIFLVLSIIQINHDTVFYRALKKRRYLSENTIENAIPTKLYSDECYDKNGVINDNNSVVKYIYEEYESYKRIKKKNKLCKNILSENKLSESKLSECTLPESKLADSKFSKYKLPNDNTNENLKSHSHLNSSPSTSNSGYYLDSKCNDNINESNSATNELIEKNVSIKYPIYNWELGKACLSKYLGHSKNYFLNGVKFDEWKLVYLEDRCYNEKNGRVHKVLETEITGNNENNKRELKLFIKRIPIDMWLKQFEMMDTYNGEYIVRAENFVMEATVLSFLSAYYPGICPKFYKLLYNPDNYYMDEKISSINNINDIGIFNKLLSDSLRMDISGYILLVSESFGEDLETYLCTINNKKKLKSRKKNKKKLLFESLKLINKLHQAGICHLDFTLDNILISKDGDMRLCDFAKSTPMYSYYLRHTKKMDNLCLFQSCITSVGKNRYVPPECWVLERRYSRVSTKYPFEYLEEITDEEERKKYYFDVSCADKYMLGIVFIAIWNNSYLWYISDPIIDLNYLKYKKCNMNFNKIWTTFFWPKKLKIILRQLLDLDRRKNLNLNDLINDPWFTR